jgi:hypothetical protein
MIPPSKPRRDQDALGGSLEPVAFTGSMSSCSGSACPPFAIVLEPLAHQWLTFDRRVAEFQVRVAVLNGFTALGMPVTEAVG